MSQTGWVVKRWRRGRTDDGDADKASRSARPAPEPRRKQDSDDPPEDLESRLGAASSAFATPPTAEELRAAFSRKKDDDTPPPRPNDTFSTRYSAESLFAATSDEELVEEFLVGEDRSRTSGDYYYDPADAWAVLGLQPGATWKEITGAHRRMAMKHHPDRLVGASAEQRAKSEETMREVNVAYSVLRRLTGR